MVWRVLGLIVGAAMLLCAVAANANADPGDPVAGFSPATPIAPYGVATDCPGGPIQRIYGVNQALDGSLLVVARCFATALDSLAPLAADRLVLVALDSTGQLDSTYGAGDGIVIAGYQPAVNDVVTSVTFDASGRILLSITKDNDQEQLVRLTAAGALDTSFSGNGIYTAQGGAATHTAVQSNGEIFFLQNLERRRAHRGPAAQFPQQTKGCPVDHVDLRVTHLTAAGALDRSYGRRGSVNIHDIQASEATLQAGKLVIAGSLVDYCTDELPAVPAGLTLARLTHRGRLDRSFVRDRSHRTHVLGRASNTWETGNLVTHGARTYVTVIRKRTFAEQAPFLYAFSQRGKLIRGFGTRGRQRVCCGAGEALIVDTTSTGGVTLQHVGDGTRLVRYRRSGQLDSGFASNGSTSVFDSMMFGGVVGGSHDGYFLLTSEPESGTNYWVGSLHRFEE